jgi:hypothetical protein
MWIFGGDANLYLNDTWGLSLGASNAWAPLTEPTALAASPRRNFGMANAGGSIVFFGGEFLGPRDDTGKLRLHPFPAWEPLSPATRPSPRFGHHLIHDPPRNRVLTFGGYDGAYLNDVHEFSLATGSWQPILPSGTPPSGRMYYGMVYDPVRQRMLMIGGHPEFQNDVWALALNGPPAWTQLSPAGTAPSPRYAHSIVYQPGPDRVILFGGYDGAYRNDVWALSLAGTPTWSQLTPAGSAPTGRWASAVIHDALRDRMIVFGGYDGAAGRNDVWALSLGAAPAWTPLAPTGGPPLPRANLDGAYDPVGDRLIVMAGYDPATGGFLSDTWQLAWGGAPTPVLVSLVDARAEPGRARIEWHVAGAGSEGVTVWRREEATAWHKMGALAPDGEERVAFEDRAVVEGARYGYRIGFREAGRDVYAGEIWLDIPSAPKLALAGARPNPAAGVLTIAYALEDSSPATLELFDTSGRRVYAHDVGSEGAGAHELRITAANSLPPGIYVARLSQNGRTRTSRVAVMH